MQTIRNEIIGITRIQKNTHKGRLGINALLEAKDGDELYTVVLEFSQGYIKDTMSQIIEKAFDKDIVIDVDDFVHFLLYSDKKYEIHSFLIEEYGEFSYVVDPPLHVMLIEKDKDGKIVINENDKR